MTPNVELSYERTAVSNAMQAVHSPVGAANVMRGRKYAPDHHLIRAVNPDLVKVACGFGCNPMGHQGQAFYSSAKRVRLWLFTSSASCRTESCVIERPCSREASAASTAAGICPRAQRLVTPRRGKARIDEDRADELHDTHGLGECVHGPAPRGQSRSSIRSSTGTASCSAVETGER